MNGSELAGRGCVLSCDTIKFLKKKGYEMLNRGILMLCIGQGAG